MEKLMFRALPYNSCPCCQHKEFLIHESSMVLYLTNMNGEIIASKENYNNTVGKCKYCGKEYSMFPTNESFIPLGKIKKIIFDYLYEPELVSDTRNNTSPMYKKG